MPLTFFPEVGWDDEENHESSLALDEIQELTKRLPIFLSSFENETSTIPTAVSALGKLISRDTGSIKIVKGIHERGNNTHFTVRYYDPTAKHKFDQEGPGVHIYVGEDPNWIDVPYRKKGKDVFGGSPTYTIATVRMFRYKIVGISTKINNIEKSWPSIFHPEDTQIKSRSLSFSSSNVKVFFQAKPPSPTDVSGQTTYKAPKFKETRKVSKN